ncbi:MAG: GGDEF domain-containing protein [Pirellulales bacterium]
MANIWLLGLGLSCVSAAVAFCAGWWLRSLRMADACAVPKPKTERKQLAEQALQGLHAAAESVRSCVDEHIECIQAVEAELKDASATEPAIISNAAESIIAANGLVQHQFNDIQRMIDHRHGEIQDHLTSPYGLFFTFASLDRQRHVYRQVLSSLENLAAELMGNIHNHGQRLKKISNGLEESEPKKVEDITEAVAQIFDATDEMQQKIESTEEHLGEQAEKVHMQAVLSHTDLLTALPNRRAFEAEVEQLAARTQGKSAYFTIMFLDLDNFNKINSQYGHQGGDVILRQAAGVAKQLMRGRDMVARYAGDTYAFVLPQTTMHDALPVAERLRAAIERTEFGHGNYPLRLTASVGIAQCQPEETPTDLVQRADQSLKAADQAGGNLCYWHDGKACFAVSSAFKPIDATQNGSSPLVTMFRRKLTGEDGEEQAAPEEKPLHDGQTLTGRSLFLANLQRRLAEWKRGGPMVSVFVLRIDQSQQLTDRFGASAESFLHQVLSRMLEAVTRDMDERCEFQDGLFAILLPGVDEANALAVAERLQSQVRQCKVRMGDGLWNITASIGLAHSAVGPGVVEVMRSAEAAMKRAAERGGDMICVGEPMSPEPVSAVV